MKAALEKIYTYFTENAKIVGGSLSEEIRIYGVNDLGFRLKLTHKITFGAPPQLTFFHKAFVSGSSKWSIEFDPDNFNFEIIRISGDIEQVQYDLAEALLRIP